MHKLIIVIVFLHAQHCSSITVTLTRSTYYAELGQTFKFTCTVTDEDAPTLGSVSFTKFGSSSACSIIPSSCSQNGYIPGYSCGCVSGQRDVYYMNISSVSVQKDEGTWMCQRRSQASNNITLPVYYGPFNNVSLDKSSPQNVTEFFSLTVVCSSTCKPCSYTWRRGTVTVSSTRTLSLTNINRNQAGDYICTATNTQTRVIATSTFTVDVQHVTVTLTGSADYAELDQTFRFTCTVTDEDAPTLGSVSFSKFGSASACSIIPSSCSQNGGIAGYRCGCVSGQSDVYYMNISSVREQNDEGTWRCQRRSQASNNMTLPVYYGPFNNVTLDKSSPQRVTESYSLTVICSSTCKPCSYTWRRGTVTVSNTKTLSLTNINRNQAGDYICTATNTQTGAVATSTFTVDVKHAPVIQEFPSSYKVDESSRLQIDCSSYTTAGNPATTSFRWTYRGSTVSYVSVLDIININRTQSGQYTCTVSNTVGFDSATVSVDVHVQYPASITSFTINSNTDAVTVTESDHVTMRCQMNSNPGSTIRLMNGSSEISRADNSLTVEHTWTTNCRQRGKYVCVASNNIGNVTESVRLIVTCSPKREVTSLQEQTAAVGDDTILSLTILSYPEPVITWFKTNSHRNLSSISSVSRVSDISVTASLTLTGVQQQDFGEYFVQADNGVGTAAIFSVRLLVATQGGCDMEFGTGLGIGFGVCIPINIIVITISIFLHRRKDVLHKEEMKKTSDITAVDPSPVSSTNRVIYSTLDDDTPTPVYERINPEETADREFNTNNEGSVHLYVN